MGNLRFLSIKDVQFVTSLSPATIYRLVKKEEFPRPLPLTNKRVGWLQEDIVRWMVSKRFGERPKYGTIESEKTKNIREAYLEGYEAFQAWYPMHLAPYRKKELRSMWVSGWKQAQYDRFGEGLTE